MTWYLDSSALVKLVVRERESEALVAFVRDNGDDVLTSDLGRLELLRFAHRFGESATARRVVDSLSILRVTAEAWQRAGEILPDSPLRSLDAVHVACLAVNPYLRGLVTYDARMTAAAASLGYAVLSPA